MTDPVTVSLATLDDERAVRAVDEAIGEIVNDIREADRGVVRLAKRSGKVTLTITVTGHEDQPGAFVVAWEHKVARPKPKPRITRAVDDHGVLLEAAEPEQMRLAVQS